MSIASALALCALLLVGHVSACSSTGEQRERAASGARQQVLDEQVRARAARLRPYERATLKSFASDAALRRYLDALAFVNDVQLPLAPGTSMPAIPEPPPPRLGLPGPSAS